MKETIRVLVVEDSKDDTLLLMHHLEKGGFNPVYKRVETEDEMKKMLDEEEWDIIIGDYILQEFGGLAALNLLQQSKLDIPFILIPGNVSETIAVEVINAGAQDCIMKDNLVRLIPAIKRELRDFNLRKSLKKAHAIKEREQHPKIDDVDKQILNLLYHDGRMTLVDIGQNIVSKSKKSFSHVGVKNRLYKLLKSDVMNIQSNLNINSLNFLFAVMLLEVESNNYIEEILKKFEHCPRILFSARASGKYNLVYGIIAENLRCLENFNNNCSPKIENGVRDSYISISTSMHQPKYLPLNIFNKEKSEENPCGVNCANCDAYKNSNCFGCPLSIYYKGF